MQFHATAIIVAVRAHGEHGAIVKILTRDHGLVAAYVQGGRSRRLKPILSAGNVIMAHCRARHESQMPSLDPELERSRAPMQSEPIAAAAIEWVTALAAVVLPEGHPYPRVYDALDGVLSAVEAAPSARAWLNALERYEALILSELGYGDGDAVGLVSNGQRLRENLLSGRRAEIMPARDRLIARLDRAIGR
jgi:DNA repair protein RecO (recombination protein O)